MALQDLLHGDRMEMLKWVSERNLHVPLSDLAFMLDMNGEPMSGDTSEAENTLYDYHDD